MKIARFFSTAPLSKTFLNEFHKKLGAKMVGFAGYEMPVNYPAGVLKEHLFCRESAALFDVSHMGQFKIYGKDRLDFVEKICVGDIENLPNKGSTLSLILNEKAGIIDDTIVSKYDDHIHMVLNAGNKLKDIAHFQKIKDSFFKSADLTFKVLDDYSLVALQGPNAHKVLADLLKSSSLDLNKVGFMTHFTANVGGINLDVYRSGYTGEDGFEISVHNNQAVAFVELLLKDQRVRAAGLGARDSLRLEAGLCLHGNDIDETTNPAEAGLMWTVRKTPKRKFNGFEELEKAKSKIERKRVGFVLDSKDGTARHGVEVVSAEGKKIGVVTSGTFSPVLKTGLGMAYVHKDFSKIGVVVKGVIRGKQVPMKISKMPFVPAKYHKIA